MIYFVSCVLIHRSMCSILIGSGSNTHVELLTLWDFLWFSQKRVLTKLMVVSESKVIIEWVSDHFNFQSLSLFPLMDMVWMEMSCFNSISFYHIYRCYNKEVDTLSYMTIGDMTGYVSFSEFLYMRISLTPVDTMCFDS